MTDGMIYHGVRKQELLKIIERSGLNFEEATSNFGFADNTRNPLSLILDGYFIQIIPMAREEHNWGCSSTNAGENWLSIIIGS